MKEFWKSVLYLFLRVLLVAFLSFMTYLLVARNPWLAPVMAVFYFIMMMYFFVFTMWFEGGKDIHRVKAGTVRYTPAKGFLSGGVVGVFMTFVYFLPEFFAQGSVARSLCWVAKFYFMMPSVYAALPFIDTAMSEADYTALKASLQGTLGTQMALVYFGFLIAWIVGAGIGYIVGYKEIKIFQPFLDKWKKD